MIFLFIQNWFSSAIAKAIGWTLIHSLWQGLLLTIIAGIFIVCSRRSKPALRYTVLAILFIVFILGSCFTFIAQLQSSAPVTPHVFPSSTAQPPGILPFSQTLQDGHSSFMDGFISYFNEHAPLIVALWFIIFLAKTARLVTYIGYAQRIRHYKTAEVPDWQKRIRELSRLLGIKQLVALRESGLARIPLTIGFLKPIILLPLGLLSNLPADQVEAILLHELAHIRRRDYVVNLLQCFGESLFFFNPAVIWLSAQIRQEREYCCDDMAIAVTGNKSTFIHALMAFQEHPVTSTVYAPAFPGKTYHLLDRIKRIIYSNNKNLNNMEKIFLASGLVLTGILALAFSSIEPVQDIKTSVVAAKQRAPAPALVKDLYTAVAVKDTVPENIKKKDLMSGTIIRTVGGKEYKIELKNDVITELYIDDKRVPDDKITEYKTITGELIIETREKTALAKKDAERMKLLAETDKMQAEASKQRVEQANERTRQAKQMADQEAVILKMKSIQDRKQTLLAKKQVEYEKSEIEHEQLEVIEERLEESKVYLKELDEINNSQKQILKQQSMLFRKQADKARLQAENARKFADADKKEADVTWKSMLADLVEAKIIQDPNHVSIQLTEESLIVNGVKQPDVIFKKFKDKYGARQGRKFNYHNKINLSNNKNMNASVLFNNKINLQKNSNIKVQTTNKIHANVKSEIIFRSNSNKTL